MARKERSNRRGREREEAREQLDANAENGEKERDQDEDQIEIVQVDPKNHPERYRPFGEGTLNFEGIDADINADKVMDEIDDFTEDEDVLEDFDERQRMINEGSDELRDEIRSHNFKSPQQSGDDIDAAWQDSVVSGEESVGGSAPTPDQDIVDELGKAVGFEYEDHEPLHTAEKLEARDQDRWELNPASVEEIEEQEDEMEDQDEEEVTGYLKGDYNLEMLEEEDLEDEPIEEEDEEAEDDEEELDELLIDEEDEDFVTEDEYDELDLDDDDLDDYLDDLDDEDED
jgi:hypothetical protein